MPKRIPAIAVISFALAYILAANAISKEALREYDVKAAFLYNFTRFTQWPPGIFRDAHTPLILCVIGENPFGDALNAVARKRSNGRPVHVLLDVDTTHIGQCHVAFFAFSERIAIEDHLSRITGPVLTVSDIPDFSERGGMIQLNRIGNRIRFEVNLAAARDHNLTISSKLLKLASSVTRRQAQP